MSDNQCPQPCMCPGCYDPKEARDFLEGRNRRAEAAEAEVERLRGALDRIGKAWPIVRDADCSGGTLVSAIDEIDAALATEVDYD